MTRKGSLDWIEGEWSDPTRLPVNDGQGWCIHEHGTETPHEHHTIVREVARSLPARPLLIGRPGSDRFTPPIMAPECREHALRTIKRNTVNITVGLTAVAIAFLTIATIAADGRALAIGLVLLALASIQFIDWRIALDNAEGVAQRSLFFYWMKRTARESLLGSAFWPVVALLIGAFQLSMHLAHGSMAGAFHAVGVMYGDVENGEWWRLLTGPLLHYSLMHYGLNAALLVVFGAFARFFLGASSLALLIVASTAAAAGQMLFGGDLYDNYGGISGGIYALLGATLSVGVMSTAALPRGLLLLLFNLGVVGIASAELTSPTAATTAHVTGLLFGMAWGSTHVAVMRRWGGKNVRPSTLDALPETKTPCQRGSIAKQRGDRSHAL